MSVYKMNKIQELLAGLYIDDGRNLPEILPMGVRLCQNENVIKYKKEWEECDRLEGLTGKQRNKLKLGDCNEFN